MMKQSRRRMQPNEEIANGGTDFMNFLDPLRIGLACSDERRQLEAKKWDQVTFRTQR